MCVQWKQNETLARIAADITGDGHLQLTEKRGVVSFISKYQKNVLKQQTRFQKLFGKKGNIKKYFSRGHH